MPVAAGERLKVFSPEVNAYEFQSQQVVNMTQKLLDKLIDDRTTLEKEDTDSLNAFELFLQTLSTILK